MIRAQIDKLNAETKVWLETELVKRGFSNYTELTELLAQRGFEISRSSVGRYGKKLKRRIQAIKDSTEAAKLIAISSPDEEDALTGSVISMIQSDTFSVLLNLQEASEADPEERLKLLSKAASAASDLARASIAHKKYSSTVRARLNAAKQAAANKAETVAKKAGLSDADWSAIRAQILGIEVENG